MAEFISERFLNQLNQYLEQKPAREPHRGHRVRDLRGGIVNRLRPLAKRSGSGPFCRGLIKIGVNTPRYTATAALAYAATVDDWHIAADCTINQVTITLPSAISVGAGKQISIKDAFGMVGAPWTIVIAGDPALPDTINLAAGMAFGVPQQSVVLISDGVSNWEVIV